uniref:Voltage-dependent T-type calcium channel subunit alpha-1I n=1 Tax=Sphaerodactylus townsendi TaxID=933632 RepID=A0ACB8FNJ9_9SAUR
MVGNLGLLFMLLFFIYAALGVELFGKLVCNDEHPCEGMSRHATFENFGMAFLTLFQVSTGDNWNGIMKDTLRDCTHDDRSCLSNLQFISPLYFVSFVLTAQFVLINVVVAVLMKHLDDSNKEAQEDAEMDAEIELEMAHGLCPCGSSSPGSGQDGGGGRVDPEGHLCMTCYSPAQENLWLDSVSLIIKDSFDGELMIIDNLSGSVFHHYSSPAMCEKCNHDKQELKLLVEAKEMVTVGETGFPTQVLGTVVEVYWQKMAPGRRPDFLPSPHCPESGKDRVEGISATVADAFMERASRHRPDLCVQWGPTLAGFGPAVGLPAVVVTAAGEHCPSTEGAAERKDPAGTQQLSS